MKIAMLVVVLGVTLALNTVQAEGDPMAGKKLSTQCASCHGPDGNSVSPNFPKLAGQHEDYIIHDLHAYKSGTRTNSTMSGMASPLSDQDIEDLAAYFSQQKGLVEPEPDYGY